MDGVRSTKWGMAGGISCHDRTRVTVAGLTSLLFHIGNILSEPKEKRQCVSDENLIVKYNTLFNLFVLSVILFSEIIY